MKVGVIGAGNWGKNLVRNFSTLGVLAGVADPEESNRRAACDVQADVPTYSTHTELIASGVDAVAIATPAQTHHLIAKEALLAGLDVFVEKPITLDPEEARELCEIAEAEGRVLMVGHLLLYQPAIEVVKEFITAGRLGRVFTLSQRRSKLGRARAVENVLWSFGVHDVAVLLELAGQVPSAIDVVGHSGLQRGVEDDVFLHMRFNDGMLAHLHNSWLWPTMERLLVVVGEKGMLVYDELTQNVTWVKKTIDKSLQAVDEGSEVIFEGSGEPLKLELEHFLNCCKTRATPRSDGRNGYEVVKVLAKAEKMLGSLRDCQQID